MLADRKFPEQWPLAQRGKETAFLSALPPPQASAHREAPCLRHSEAGAARHGTHQQRERKEGQEPPRRPQSPRPVGTRTRQPLRFAGGGRRAAGRRGLGGQPPRWARVQGDSRFSKAESSTGVLVRACGWAGQARASDAGPRQPRCDGGASARLRALRGACRRVQPRGSRSLLAEPAPWCGLPRGGLRAVLERRAPRVFWDARGASSPALVEGGPSAGHRGAVCLSVCGLELHHLHAARCPLSLQGLPASVSPSRHACMLTHTRACTHTHAHVTPPTFSSSHHRRAFLPLASLRGCSRDETPSGRRMEL